VFFQKSAQAIENKGWEREKERQERKRVRKEKKMRNLPQRRSERGGKKIVDGHRGRVTPGGNADGYQNKGLAGKAIRNNMKTKGGKIDST
jgi:hypothetical protein